MPQVAIPIAASVAGSLASKAISGGGGGSSGGGGGGASSGDSQYLREKAAGLYDSLPLPTFDRSAYTPYSYLGDVNAETWAPWIAQFADIDPNDKDAVAAQMAALEQLQKYGSGAWLPQDQMAANNIIRSQAGATNDAFQQGANSLQSRGLFGSGAELALRAAAGQTGADASNKTWGDMYTALLNRELGATTQAGTLATNMAGQQQTLATNKAQMNNAFNNAVMNLKAQAASQNAAAKNNMAVYNQSTKQGTADKNVGLLNTSKDKNNSYTQQEFSNALNRTTGQANALNSQATGVDAGQAAAAMQTAASNQLAINGANLGLQGLKAAGGVEGVQAGLSGLGNLITNNNIQPPSFSDDFIRSAENSDINDPLTSYAKGGIVRRSLAGMKTAGSC